MKQSKAQATKLRLDLTPYESKTTELTPLKMAVRDIENEQRSISNRYTLLRAKPNLVKLALDECNNVNTELIHEIINVGNIKAFLFFMTKHQSEKERFTILEAVGILKRAAKYRFDKDSNLNNVVEITESATDGKRYFDI